MPASAVASPRPTLEQRLLPRRPVLRRLHLADRHVLWLRLRHVAGLAELRLGRQARTAQHAGRHRPQHALQQQPCGLRVVSRVLAVLARVAHVVLGVLELGARALLPPLGLVQVRLGRAVGGVGGVDRRLGAAVAQQRIGRHAEQPHLRALAGDHRRVHPPLRVLLVGERLPERLLGVVDVLARLLRANDRLLRPLLRVLEVAGEHRDLQAGAEDRQARALHHGGLVAGEIGEVGAAGAGPGAHQRRRPGDLLRLVPELDADAFELAPGAE